MSTVIKVEALSKQYRLGTVGSVTFKEDALKFWAKLRGKVNPYSLEGEENDRITFSKSDYVWSLKDINFEVQQGDVLGIIGKNGAGKSTLLKILSKVTAPTNGSVKAKGRIASLLEVGTGFHPELTGRDNIYLNGAILGMRKYEITRKLDEIIAFAGVERYIDTPVKRYSSGMYVRLAFAVAAHLEAEILIIDEVLAVGDADFQKKCLEKMNEVTSECGRSILFVSHNIGAIQNLCKRVLYLENGKNIFNGDIYEGISKYNRNRNFISNNNLKNRLDRNGNGKLMISKITLKQFNGLETDVFGSGESMMFELKIINNYYPNSLINVSASIDIFDSNGITVQLYRTNFTNSDFTADQQEITLSCFVKENYLAAGTYYVNTFLGFNYETFDDIENVCSFRIEGGNFFGTGINGLPSHCKLLTKVNWCKK